MFHSHPHDWPYPSQLQKFEPSGDAYDASNPIYARHPTEVHCIRAGEERSEDGEED